MQKTIFSTPLISGFFYHISRLILMITGWRLEGEPPDLKKYVIIVAPHTSNWDFILGLVFCFYSRNDVYWLGKSQLFRRPFGVIMKWLGGIPVDRSKSNNLVSSVVDQFRENESLVIAISPDGTRSSRGRWKTGFYYIADGAGIPVSLAFIDYGKKRAGYGKLFYTTGNMDKDLAAIKEFYKDIRGRKQV